MTLITFNSIGMMGMGFDPVYLIIMAVASGISFIAGAVLKGRFKKFSKMEISLSGAEIAHKMLEDAGISDVQIISTPGQLTDHYNPKNSTLSNTQRHTAGLRCVLTWFLF